MSENDFEYVTNKYISENTSEYITNDFSLNTVFIKNRLENESVDNESVNNIPPPIKEPVPEPVPEPNKIIVSLTNIISEQDFKTLNEHFTELCNKNMTITRSDLELLINNEIDNVKCHRHHFIDQYLNNFGKNYRFSFIDYYTIIIHLQNLNNINVEKSLELSKLSTAALYDETMLDISYQQIYTKVANEEKMLKLTKNRDSIKKDQFKQNSINKYELEVDLYSKQNLGLTCKGTCQRLLCCFGQHIIKDYDHIYDIIKELPTLNNYQKNLILIRFQSILKYCIKHYNTISRWYNSSQMFIIACSIVNPALLSINSDKNNAHYFTIFWSVWISQLLVSLVTSYVAYFKWDKKYFLFNSYKSRINQEIWYFIELSGGPYKNNSTDNFHADHIITFLNRLERLYKHLKLSEFEIDNTSNEEETTNKDKSISKTPTSKEYDDKEDTNSGILPTSPKPLKNRFLDKTKSNLDNI